MTTIAEKYFPSLTEEQRRQFSLLPSLYAEWNEKINVISRKDIENFEVNHLLHSLSVARFINFLPGTAVIDIGTGGGLPGIPLAILFPEVKFTLIDSIAKKIRVVNEITAAAGIGNVLARTVRSENTTGEYDFIIGRAVTEMETVCEDHEASFITALIQYHKKRMDLPQGRRPRQGTAALSGLRCRCTDKQLV
ncbi:MAG: 16S rRNA (guanine(527)-N(7))-methyltransferase RsmG [Marinilabiliales bacterium]|nr:16S rRNA (guanine(527)-N(7))-methyltransferase RsmG [Marinilabiliales bacterium]